MAPPADPDDVVVLEIEDSLDLHTFQPRDIPDVVDSYLEAAHARGLREVRLIHGKGTGFQRQRVRSVLAAHPLVADFADAPPARGGWGATSVWLVALPAPPSGRR
jgi:DNA-nicking Smr family endonuclease